MDKVGNMYPLFSDEYYMQLALYEAEAAAEAGEIPVGAVIVCQRKENKGF
jgi:tRNA(adenine34) deaminase